MTRRRDSQIRTNKNTRQDTEDTEYKEGFNDIKKIAKDFKKIVNRIYLPKNIELDFDFVNLPCQIWNTTATWQAQFAHKIAFKNLKVSDVNDVVKNYDIDRRWFRIFFPAGIMTPEGQYENIVADEYYHDYSRFSTRNYNSVKGYNYWAGKNPINYEKKTE